MTHGDPDLGSVAVDEPGRGADPRLRRAAELLEANLHRVVDDYLARLESDRRVSPYFAIRDLRSALGRGASAAFREGLRMLQGGIESQPTLVPELADVAREWAQRNLDPALLTEMYALGQDEFWEVFERSLEASEPDADTRWKLAKTARIDLFGRTQRYCELLRDAYAAERAALARSSRLDHRSWIHQVLAGRNPEHAVPAYDLSGHHLAIVSWGRNGRRLVPELARLAAMRFVATTGIDEATWGWLGSAKPPSEPAVDEMISRARRSGGRVAFGEAAGGSDGFRRSHAQALDARRYAAMGFGGVIRYREVALVALAGSSRAAAAAFQAEELRGLASDDDRSRALRETLRVYLEHGQSAKVTAALLGIHRGTVSHHLTAVEAALGHPIAERSAELLLALRLVQLDEHTRTAPS